MNESELAAARGRVARGKLVVLFCLLMVPVSAVASCGGAFFLPENNRAFVILPAFGLPVVFLVVAFFARRRPRAAAAEVALIGWADENGFTYHRRAAAKKTEAERVYTMGGVIERKFHMTGEADGVRVELLNRWSYSGLPGVNAVEAEQTEVALVGAVAAGWNFALIPKEEMGQVNDLTTGERARFRDDREFDRAFVVYAADAAKLEAGLPDRFVARCLKRPEYTVVARGGALLVFRLNYVCNPAGYDDLLGHALALAAALR